MSRSPILVGETLRNEDSVRETEVYRDGDYDGDETGPKASNEVRYVADEPDKDEEEGDGLCVSIAVVFNELGDLSEGDQCWTPFLISPFKREIKEPTSKNIQQVKETDPKRPEAASRGVNSTDSSPDIVVASGVGYT